MVSAMSNAAEEMTISYGVIGKYFDPFHHVNVEERLSLLHYRGQGTISTTIHSVYFGLC